jgi:hypothetical protein
MCTFPIDPAHMTVPQRKHDIILKLFVQPADEDYLVARWSYRMGVFLPYYWAAAQAVEKYLKASLLASGLSSKGFGHDLVRLFDDVANLDTKGFIPKTIAMPDTTGSGKDAWDTHDTRSFIHYLAGYGDPDNRYGIVGRRVVGPDIHVLDAVCLGLRSMVRNFGILPRCAALDLPWHLSCDGLLEQLSTGRRTATVHAGLADEFKNMNLAYFAKNQDGSTFGGQHWSMSPLYVHLIKTTELNSSSENMKAVAEVKSWVKAHIQVGKASAKALKL